MVPRDGHATKKTTSAWNPMPFRLYSPAGEAQAVGHAREAQPTRRVDKTRVAALTSALGEVVRRAVIIIVTVDGKVELQRARHATQRGRRSLQHGWPPACSPGRASAPCRTSHSSRDNKHPNGGVASVGPTASSRATITADAVYVSPTAGGRKPIVLCVAGTWRRVASASLACTCLYRRPRAALHVASSVRNALVSASCTRRSASSCKTPPGAATSAATTDCCKRPDWPAASGRPGGVVGIGAARLSSSAARRRSLKPAGTPGARPPR